MWSPLNIFTMETWILIITLLGLGRYYLHWKWQYLKSINIPHDPPSLLAFGHWLHLVGHKSSCFEYENEMKKKHGPVWGVYSLTTPSITIHDPDILKQILIKEFPTFSVRQKTFTKLFGKELNNGLTAIEGNQWKRIRSSMTPTFSILKIKQMMYIIERCVDNTKSSLERKIERNEGIFSSKMLFCRLSLDVVCSAAFGVEVNSQDDSMKEPEISMHAKKLFAVSLVNPVLLLCALFPKLERIADYFNWSMFGKDQLNYFKHLVHVIMEQRKKSEHDKAQRVDLMQLMLDNEVSEVEAKAEKLDKGMDKTEIIGNSMLMILAGYENTGNAMSFMSYNLAQNPETQRQLQEEIDEMMASHGVFDYESVNSLKYLDMCINETLRLQTPILRNNRICAEEITIKGLTIPKGMIINIPTYGLAHDPDFWEEPDKFNPERMRDMTRIDPMVFQPFGAGQRNCIGMRFAMMEIKLCMAKLLHRFSFEPTEDTPKPPLQLIMGLSMNAAIDYKLRVVRR